MKCGDPPVIVFKARGADLEMLPDPVQGDYVAAEGSSPIRSGHGVMTAFS